MISRMRSSPANASLICVPIDAICTTGKVTRPTKKTYRNKSPRVMRPARMSRPPTMAISTPTPPTTIVANADSADVPVMVLAMLRNRRLAPFVKTISSRFSAVYTFTTRTPPSACPRRPDTSALILLRSRKIGRSLLNAYAMTPPKSARMNRIPDVSRQLV